MDRQSIEQTLFSWHGWEDEGPFNLGFSDVVLKVQIGQFPVGAKFPFAWVMGEQSTLILIDEQDQQHGFSLTLTVGDPVELITSSNPCDCGHEH